LLPERKDHAVTETTAIQMIPVGDISPSPVNPRSDLGEIGELAASITSLGIIQPLTVRPTANGLYLLVAGERRYAAALAAGLTEVPAIVREINDKIALEIALMENCQRRDLDPTDEARAYRTLISEHGYTQRNLAKQIGRSQSHIAKRLALLELPEDIRSEVDSGGITLPDAAELARLAKWPERLDAARKQSRNNGGVEAAVREQLRRQEAEAAAKKAAKELRSKGITVLDWPNGSWYGQPARPVSFLQGVDEDAHASEPCHAASVNPAGEIVAVCTDPSRHPRPEPSVITPELSPERQAEIEAERARRDALNAAAEARRSFLTKLLTQRIAKGEVLQHVSLIFVSVGDGLSWEHYEDAWGLLHVAGQKVSHGDDVHAALATYAAQGPDQAARAGLALALALGDQILDSTWSADWTRARVHLEFLQRHGYVLSDAERQELDRATADQDAEAGE
jgi:ParB family chromosome partitioning protein